MSNLELWLKNEFAASKRFARRAMIRLFGAKCQRCGWSEAHSITGNIPVQLHHIDGNDKNSRRDNVDLLCPNCHSLTPNFMGLNWSARRELNSVVLLPKQAVVRPPTG